MSQLSDQIAAIETEVADLKTEQAAAAQRESDAKAALQSQIDTLNQQVATLQAQIAAGQQVTPQDLANLTDIATGIQDVTNTLKSQDQSETPVNPTP